MSAHAYIHLQNIQVSFGPRHLFSIENLTIYQGDRIGLVGLNGSGKTTLLRILSGEIKPEAGTVRIACQPFYFHQFSPDMPSTSHTAPLELSLFGVQNLLEQSTVSGGENTRLRLAEVFSTDHPFLLLDEPSSNLDRQGLSYLNQRLYLAETLVLVSHDRDLLNNQCSRILEIDNGTVRSYDGNYDDYLQQKQEAQERALAEYAQYTEEMNRLQQAYQSKKEKARKIEKKPRGMSSSEAKVREFTASHRSPASKAQMLERSAQNIQMRMQHMEVKEKPREVPRIRPDFRLTDPPQNKIILEAEHLSYAYPQGKTIFQDTAFRLNRGSRTALLGGNGAGKTTLLRLIEEGQLIRSVPKARLGFFHQDLGDLKAHHTVLESVMEVSVQKESVARTMLARLLFPARDMQKSVSVLSGGEKIRLCFARLFVSSANVLILDEPTNYLDIPSVEALEKLFTEYEGTMLFVSHDASFVRTVATEALRIENQQIIPCDPA